VALPVARHGHRIERIDGGLLAFGGFVQDSPDQDRGSRETWFLADGGTRWQRRADLNLGRAFFGSAVISGSVFAIGGGVERYDARADRWTTVIPDGALPQSHFAAAACDGRLWVLGGFPGTGTGMWEVDVQSASVTQVAPPPSFRPGDHFHFLCTLRSELHAIGGLDGERFEPRREHQVLRQGQWQPLPELPAGMWAKFAAQALHDGKLYLFGDFGGFCFDPEPCTWTAKSPMPFPLVMPAAVTLGDRIWIIGGMTTDRARVVLLEYDVREDRFSDRAP
jgi:hypothetical protein